MRTIRITILAMAAAGCLVTGCSGSGPHNGVGDAGAKSVTVAGQTISVSGPLKLAVFVGGEGNAYSTSLVRGFREAISQVPGASLTVFDGKFDGATQLNQIQNAIQSGRFNAFSVGAVDPQLVCDALTKDAPKANILVTVELNPICGRASNSGDTIAAPGTLSFVGGPYLYDYYTDYLKYILQQNPGPQKLIVLSGQPLNPIADNLVKAVHDVAATHPELSLVGVAQTDFSTSQGNAKTTGLLLAHPDTTLLFSPVSDLTKGAVAAIQAAGRQSSVKVYDILGDSWDFQQVRSGTIAATALEDPVSAAKTIVQTFVDARAGKPVKPVYLNDGAPFDQTATASGLTLVTPRTIGRLHSWEAAGS